MPVPAGPCKNCALLDNIWIVPLVGGALGRFISGVRAQENSQDAIFLRGEFQDVEVLRELLGPHFKGGIVDSSQSDALKDFLEGQPCNIVGATSTSIAR